MLQVVFVPSDKRKRDEAAPAPADAPPEVLSPTCTRLHVHRPSTRPAVGGHCLSPRRASAGAQYMPVHSLPQSGPAPGQNSQSQYFDKQEGKQRSRDKKPRNGDADAEAQPAAPPSEFSSSLRAEVQFDHICTVAHTLATLE